MYANSRMSVDTNTPGIVSAIDFHRPGAGQEGIVLYVMTERVQHRANAVNFERCRDFCARLINLGLLLNPHEFSRCILDVSDPIAASENNFLRELDSYKINCLHTTLAGESFCGTLS